MIPALFAGAGLLFIISALSYYHGRFTIAAVLGALYYGALAPAVLDGMGPVGAAAALLLLAVAPATYLGVHMVDARRGLFLLPTIYAIPIAFLTGLLLWAIAGVALVL